MMKSKQLQANILLFLAALIWGFAFVAQRKGMEYVEPFTFNGLRFVIGAIVLIPTFPGLFTKKKQVVKKDKKLLVRGLIAGLVLFVASSLQQVGMLYTTAGKAGFITSLYILFVPALGLLLGRSPGRKSWLAAIIATFGLYLLSVHGQMQLSPGDLLVLISALFWAIHMMYLSHIAPHHDARFIAFLQFAFSGLLSLVIAYFFENYSWQAIMESIYPIIYAGVFSAGIGFTIQIAAQRYAKAHHAALILSLEAVFAAIGGFLILGELMTMTQLLGCMFMLAAVIWIQMGPRKKTA